MSFDFCCYSYCCSSGDSIWISISIWIWICYYCSIYFGCGCGYDPASPLPPSSCAFPPWRPSFWPWLRPSWPCAPRVPSPSPCARIRQRALVSSSPAAPGRTLPPLCAYSCRCRMRSADARFPPPSFGIRRGRWCPSFDSAALGCLATADCPHRHSSTAHYLCLGQVQQQLRWHRRRRRHEAAQHLRRPARHRWQRQRHLDRRYLHRHLPLHRYRDPQLPEPSGPPRHGPSRRPPRAPSAPAPICRSLSCARRRRAPQSARR